MHTNVPGNYHQTFPEKRVKGSEKEVCQFSGAQSVRLLWSQQRIIHLSIKTHLCHLHLNEVYKKESAAEFLNLKPIFYHIHYNEEGPPLLGY